MEMSRFVTLCHAMVTLDVTQCHAGDKEKDKDKEYIYAAHPLRLFVIFEQIKKRYSYRLKMDTLKNQFSQVLYIPLYPKHHNANNNIFLQVF